MIHTRNIWDCAAAHDLTNLLLGLFVVTQSAWRLWVGIMPRPLVTDRALPTERLFSPLPQHSRDYRSQCVHHHSRWAKKEVRSLITIWRARNFSISGLLQLTSVIHALRLNFALQRTGIANTVDAKAFELPVFKVTRSQ